jgi:hypothetical protein
VLKLDGAKELSLLDTSSRKRSQVSLPSANFVFAAGGDRAVVFLREPCALASVDLKTLKVITSSDLPKGTGVVGMAMGYAHGGSALLRLKRPDDQSAVEPHWLLDVQSLKMVKCLVDQQAPYGPMIHLLNPARRGLHYRSNADLTRVSCWSTSGTPTGVFLLIRSGARYRPLYNHDSFGFLAMGADSKIYSAAGVILSDAVAPDRTKTFDEIATVGRVAEQSLIPALGALGYLGVRSDGRLFIYPAGKLSPTSELEPFADWAPPEDRPLPPDYRKELMKLPPGMLELDTASRMTLDKRLLYAPELGFIAYVPNTNDKIVFRVVGKPTPGAGSPLKKSTAGRK